MLCCTRSLDLGDLRQSEKGKSAPNGGSALCDICRSSVRALLAKCPSVQWQPDGLTIHAKKWFLGSGFLGAPPLSLRQSWAAWRLEVQSSLFQQSNAGALAERKQARAQSLLGALAASSSMQLQASFVGWHGWTAKLRHRYCHYCYCYCYCVCYCYCYRYSIIIVIISSSSSGGSSSSSSTIIIIINRHRLGVIAARCSQRAASQAQAASQDPGAETSKTFRRS